MDGQRFDAITRTLATGASRRAIIRSLGAGLVASLSGAVGPARLATASCAHVGGGCSEDASCCGGLVCVTGTCQAAGGQCAQPGGACATTADCCGSQVCTGGICVAGNCVPGSVCTLDADCCGGQICINGTCALAQRPAGCPTGQIRCQGICVDPAIDDTNCGACGVVCATGQACCNSTCIDPSTDPQNCGVCGNLCPSVAPELHQIPVCVAGQCTLTCAVGFGNCDGAPANGCETNLLTNGAHCGACGNFCPGDPVTATCCAGICHDVATDEANCGACGNACGSGQSCISGQCV